MSPLAHGWYSQLSLDSASQYLSGEPSVQPLCIVSVLTKRYLGAKTVVTRLELPLRMTLTVVSKAASYSCTQRLSIGLCLSGLGEHEIWVKRTTQGWKAIICICVQMALLAAMKFHCAVISLDQGSHQRSSSVLTAIQNGLTYFQHLVDQRLKSAKSRCILEIGLTQFWINKANTANLSRIWDLLVRGDTVGPDSTIFVCMKKTLFKEKKEDGTPHILWYRLKFVTFSELHIYRITNSK